MLEKNMLEKKTKPTIKGLWTDKKKGPPDRLALFIKALTKK
jgi:hypothetical protein